MATQPTVSMMTATSSYFALRGDMQRVVRWLEMKRDRIRFSPYGKGLSGYWDIRSSWLLSKHRELISRLEDLYTNTESSLRPSLLSPIRAEFNKLWKSVPESPTCPVAKNERERTVLAFGYDPGAQWNAEKRAKAREVIMADETDKQRVKRELIEAFCEDLNKKGAFVRQQEFRHRVITEMVGRDHWYVVFNTLTVNDAHYAEVWDDRERHSNIWQKYIARITYDVGLALGLKKGEYRQSEIHRYAAVVESGSKNGRLHIHSVHYLKELPDGMVDPNRGRSVPSHQEISAFKKYWEYGFSVPRAVRTSPGDSYGRLGWRWPVQRPKRPGSAYVPLRTGTIAGIGHYLAKYLSKELSGKDSSEEKDRWHYRTKMTRGFGLDPYRQLMSELTPSQLRKVCMEPQIVPMLEVNGWRPPQTLVIREATREYLKRMSMRGSSKIYNLLHDIHPMKNIVRQFSETLDILTMDRLTLSEEVNIGFTLIGSMTSTGISDAELGRQRKMVPAVQAKINAIFGGPVPVSLVKNGPVEVWT